ncbi:hypothetical protein GQ43DRAFT_370825 [Delitschia confertaspora ATCC 74209]|uniref:Ubiquitin 3 binding protein But2 C-terminal domain-containing protein n=1 Tax=Delitschia confertaspora ATCC 74209 TaxID=1513339 RepID=A0A9P4JLI2_9PLEO|nr:hypothetical protein GQ43DRAFT_370825 [Delitschia confertaspora ATCC 74209]
MLPILSTTLLLLSTLSLALPHTRPSRDITTQEVSQTWTITSMNMHFMGSNTGLPGNTWPDDKKFDTTLDFTISFPDTTSTKCSTSWKYTSVPLDMAVACEAESGVAFVLTEGMGGKTSEANWGLGVRKVVSDRKQMLTVKISSSESTSTYQSQTVFVTNNDPSNANSYLTCLGGAPYDGVRCNLGGMLSTRNPFVLSAGLVSV